jgi:hypothetical protein
MGLRDRPGSGSRAVELSTQDCDDHPVPGTHWDLISSTVSHVPSTKNMTLAKTADLVIRAAAVLSAIAVLFAVLIVGLMANDSNTPGGLRAQEKIVDCGTVLVAWVMLTSIIPSTVTKWLPPWPGLAVLVVRVPSYAFGLGGIIYGSFIALGVVSW